MVPRPEPPAGRIQVMGSGAWKKTPEGHVLKIGFPGLKKEDVNVVVKQGHLQISEKGKKEPMVITLPKNAKAVKVKDSMENGVLTVTVPKLEEKKGKAKVEKKKR